MSWGVWYKTEIHIIPDYDDPEHVVSSTCWCNPTQDEEHTHMWVHNDTLDREVAVP
jgi:hypothetical protein